MVMDDNECGCFPDDEGTHIMVMVMMMEGLYIFEIVNLRYFLFSFFSLI